MQHFLPSNLLHPEAQVLELWAWKRFFKMALIKTDSLCSLDLTAMPIDYKLGWNPSSMATTFQSWLMALAKGLAKFCIHLFLPVLDCHQRPVQDFSIFHPQHTSSNSYKQSPTFISIYTWHIGMQSNRCLLDLLLMLCTEPECSSGSAVLFQAERWRTRCTLFPLLWHASLVCVEDFNYSEAHLLDPELWASCVEGKLGIFSGCTATGFCENQLWRRALLAEILFWGSYVKNWFSKLMPAGDTSGSFCRAVVRSHENHFMQEKLPRLESQIYCP